MLTAEATGACLDFQLSKPDEVNYREVGSREAIELGGQAPGDRVAALAAANAARAVVIEVGANAELTEPILLELSGSTVDQLVHGHLIFSIGKHAKVTIVVRHTGSATYAALTQVLAGDGSDVTFVSLADWADDAVHAGQTSITVGRDARVRSIAVSLGGDLLRLAENASYAGPGGSVEQFGLYFVDSGQHIEHRLFVDHNAPNTSSNVDYRGALQGAGAHAVWVGDVLIRKVAEGIDTYESNKNLLLTEGARADSVPNLEIETGKIEGAGHSSTTGRFDDEQLFYLRSRGIDETEARRLVVHGFFADIIQRIGVPQLQEQLLFAIEAELAVSIAATTTEKENHGNA